MSTQKSIQLLIYFLLIIDTLGIKAASFEIVWTDFIKFQLNSMSYNDVMRPSAPEINSISGSQVGRSVKPQSSSSIGFQGLSALEPYPIGGSGEVKPPYPVEVSVQPPYPTEKTVQPPYPTESTLQSPYPVENRIQTPYPTENTFETPYPVEKPVCRTYSKEQSLPKYPVQPPYNPNPIPYPEEIVKSTQLPSVIPPFPTQKSVQSPYPVEKSFQPPYPVEKSFQTPYPVEKSVKPPYPVEKSVQPPYPVAESFQPPYPVEKSVKPPYPVSESGFYAPPLAYHSKIESIKNIDSVLPLGPKKTYSKEESKYVDEEEAEYSRYSSASKRSLTRTLQYFTSEPMRVQCPSCSKWGLTKIHDDITSNSALTKFFSW